MARSLLFTALAILLLLLALSDKPCWAACSVSTSNVAFGNYSGTQTDSNGTVSVTCSTFMMATFNYTITIATGLSNSFNPRQMANGSNRLNYNLYTDSTRITVWGNGTNGTATVSDSITVMFMMQATKDYPVYSRIPSGQGPLPGSYSDPGIFVTITY